MTYQHNGAANTATEEAYLRAKFLFYRTAESAINAGPAPVNYHPAPIRERKAAPECGTHSGYKTHILNKTPTCHDCRQARAHYQREYRAGRKCAA